MGDKYEAAEAAYGNESTYSVDDVNEFMGSQHHQHYGAAIPREHYALMPKIRVARGGIRFGAASPSPTGSPVLLNRDQALGLVKSFQEAYPSVQDWFEQTKEGKHMRNTQDLLTEAEELRDQAAQLEKIARERDKYGDDPFKNGTVLKVDMKYRTSPRSFAYGVVKVGGKFYLTGKLVNAHTTGSDTAAGFTWEQFVAWLSQGDATVWQAKSLQQVF